ncbi:uncharacterized protein ACBR49_006464 [Aulostomus maculatus]
MFFLSGLNETMNYRWFLFCLTLLSYCVVLLVNVSVIAVIILDKNIHEPMYILPCTFCLNGLYGTTGFYPNFLWDLLAPAHVVSYSGCLIQAQVMFSFACCDLTILAVMAYDRYLAICRPLEYHSIMSKQRIFSLVCYSCLTPFCVMGINVCLTSRVKLCSPFIARMYCVNWTIVKLACFPSETIINGIVAYITMVIFTSHGLFITWSYKYLIKTCVNSLENRAKFMQTCVPHLISLLTFLVTILFDVMTGEEVREVQEVREVREVVLCGRGQMQPCDERNSLGCSGPKHLWLILLVHSSAADSDACPPAHVNALARLRVAKMTPVDASPPHGSFMEVFILRVVLSEEAGGAPAQTEPPAVLMCHVSSSTSSLNPRLLLDWCEILQVEPVEGLRASPALWAATVIIILFTRLNGSLQNDSVPAVKNGRIPAVTSPPQEEKLFSGLGSAAGAEERITSLRRRTLCEASSGGSPVSARDSRVGASEPCLSGHPVG